MKINAVNKTISLLLVLTLLFGAFIQPVMASNGKGNKQNNQSESKVMNKTEEVTQDAKVYDDLALSGLKQLAEITTSSDIVIDSADIEDILGNYNDEDIEETDNDKGDGKAKGNDKKKEKHCDKNESNLLGLLIKDYETAIESEYLNGVFLKSTYLLDIKSKLAVYLKVLNQSKDISVEDRNLIKDIQDNFYLSNNIVCINGIILLDYLIKVTDNKKSEKPLENCLKNGIKHKEKASDFQNKGLEIPSMQSYRNSYKEVVKGFEKAEYKLDNSFFETELDTDGDTLTDGYELLFGTNPFSVDTDNDGVSDDIEFELYPYCDPTKADTDADGILDRDEDLDGDGLTILQEIEYQTHNLSPDTDDDSLSDYDEIFIYRTNPLVADSDGDGLDDGAEIKLGLDPLNSDSNQDGIPDGSEKIEQTLSQFILSDEQSQITNVSVSMAGTGIIEETTTIKNTYGTDILSSEVAGLIGVPVDINSTSEFAEATITFSYDEELLGNTLEEDLRVMWYDEENNQYVILDAETVLDAEANTLSYTTTHFSTYMVVDRQAWYDVWSNAITYRRDPPTSGIPTEYFDICYVIDRSGSMSGSRITTAKGAISDFIDAMYAHDRGAIVGFNSSSSIYISFVQDKLLLKDTLKGITATGGTNVEAGLVTALDLFDSADINYVNNIPNSKLIILLCDGDVYYTDATLQRAKEDSIKIYPVLIGSTSGQTALQHIADVTGGKFYYAATAEEIRKAIWGVQEDTIGEIDTTDTDGDGLYDIYETAGMMLPNGKVIYTDPQKKDTDGDGLSDAEEMGVLEDFNEKNILKQLLLELQGFDSDVYAEYFDYVSDPIKKDTDGDEYSDYVEVKTYNSKPLKNEVEFHRWNQDFFSVDYTGSEPWVNEGNVFYGTTLSYGGSQMWFSDKANEDWWSTGYIIENVGCGLISSADILLYLSLKDGKYATTTTDLISFDSSNNVDYLSYIDYIYQMNETHLPVLRWIGKLGPDIAFGIDCYSLFNGLGLNAKWCTSKDKMLPRMIEMLDDDIPITLGIYTSNENEGVYLYNWIPQTNDKYSFNVEPSFNKVNSHYITITGIMIDGVKGQTILEISSWGYKFYISYEEYIAFVDKNSNYIFNNIVYIER